MTEPRVIDFELAHLGEGKQVYGDFSGAGNVAYTAVLGEEIIGCAGIILIWGKGSGVGELWLNMWARERDLMLWFCKSCKDLLAKEVAEKKLWRVQCHIDAADEQAQNWIQWLGLSPCGYDEHFLPDGRDALRFYRIYEENLR